MKGTILIVDELQTASLLRDYLRHEGLDVECLEDGSEVELWVRAHKPDLIILDLTLPGRDGMEVCRDIRSFSAVPIIMLTARGDLMDRVRGLEAGADDYICKPFAPEEVVARVKAVLRRAVPCPEIPVSAPGLVLDPDRIMAVVNGRSATLTAVEFNLLQVLMANQGRVLSRNQIMEQLYVDNRTVNGRTIDCHVKKLRKKLMDVAPKVNCIRSVYGVGYCFDASVNNQITDPPRAGLSGLPGCAAC